MSTRARSVLEWIDAMQGADLDEWCDDVIADHRFLPGQVLLIAPLPLLPLDLNVFGEPS